LGSNNVIAFECHGKTNQQWYLSGNNLKTRHDDNLCLHYDTQANNAIVRECNSDTNQQWYFKNADPASACMKAKTLHEIASLVCPRQTKNSSVSGTGTAMYGKVKRSVIKAYESLSSTCDANTCEQADFVGAVLRTAGHDFMDWNGDRSTGGSDGCVDFDDEDNAGLKPSLCGAGEFWKGATLNEVYKEFCGTVSYADFLVIASEAVMIRTRPDYSSKTQTSPTLSFDFKFGRETSTSCKKTSDTALPNAMDGCSAVDEVFNKRMGLNDWRASAALMGVHSLGRMRAENSGFEGWWNTGKGAKTFDNDFYKSMTVGWRPKKDMGPKKDKAAWMRADNGPTTDLFLDTDLCLYQGKDITAANAPDACHWSVIRNGISNNNHCIDPLGFFDRSLFPFLGCCSAFADIIVPDVLALPLLCGSDDPCFLNEGAGGNFGPGAATDAVIEFALNEKAWLRDFKKAWKKATENNLPVR